MYCSKRGSSGSEVGSKRVQSEGHHDAKQQAHRILLPKYRKAFREMLGDFFVKRDSIRKEPVYGIIADTAKDLRNVDGMDREESIRSAINFRKYKLNLYINEELEDDDDEMNTDNEMK